MWTEEVAVACDDPYQPFNSHLSYNPVGEQGDDKVTKTLVAGSQAVDTVASGKWLLYVYVVTLSKRL